MTRNIQGSSRSDPLTFGPPDPYPLLFSLDPDPNPTCNNGIIKLFLSYTKYKPESTNSSLKLWFIRSNFMPTYLNYIYIFFFISNQGRIRSRIQIRIWSQCFFFSQAGSGSMKKYWILIPGNISRFHIMTQ